MALFLIGLVYAVITIFIGDIFSFSFDASGGSLPYLSPTTIGSFLTVFGGCGYFLSVNTSLPGILIGIIASLTALCISALMFVFIVLPLIRSEKNAAKSSQEMIGKVAEVVTTIVEGSKGEIIYEQGGIRLSAPAKLTGHGEPITQGELVRIVDVVSGTFIVKQI
ncbi:MAG: NfeD family protein [Candidatus Cohnella colombiensis]|uniref:NfeD family protein n=1 Tax=Candidatus Cohnella colombiensis TaxID=3121368 RepID=A0AA95EWD3_9BACL|nr:MAG: NfeD family protein [Cohnella sp.]